MLPARVEGSLITLFAVTCFFLFPTCAIGQLIVDCSGNTPGAFTTINSVVPLLTNGAVVRITGSCTGNVNITGLDDLWIGSPMGQTATLDGKLTIKGVHNLFLYGMNVTNPNGDGIDITNSSGVTLDTCTSNNNGQFGLGITDSIVTVQNTGAFNNNGNFGIWATGAGDLSFNAPVDPITVNNNVGGGISLQDGIMHASGNLNVSNNTVSPGSFQQLTGNASGYGIVFQGHARAVFYVGNPAAGPNIISGNQAGGIAIHEGSEISLSGAPQNGSGPWQTNVLDGNGPVGIYVGLGSQLTLWNGVQITNHSDAAIDAYGQSEVFVAGTNVQITNNATGPASTYPTRAGIRVDGNSEAYIRGGQISQNGGPGILELDNSSADISGATLTSNLGGPVVCDSSAWLASAPPVSSASVGSARPCNVPNNLPPRARPMPAHQIPDTSQLESTEANYRRLMSSF